MFPNPVFLTVQALPPLPHFLGRLAALNGAWIAYALLIVAVLISAYTIAHAPSICQEVLCLKLIVFFHDKTMISLFRQIFHISELFNGKSEL